MRGLFAFAAATALGVSLPAHGAVIINRGDIGASIAVNYNGAVLGFPNSGLGASSNFVFTGASEDGRTYNFSYALRNDSTAASRLRSFSFDVLGSTAVTGLSSTGTYATSFINPLSGLLGSDLCFSASGGLGCTAGVAGPSAGQSGTGSFALTFASAMSSVQLDDFGVTYQGVGFGGLFGGTGTGQAVLTPATPTTPVNPGTGTPPVVPMAPESATWMMMILGFGLIGGMLRNDGRRRFQPA